jgi:hypothetical protein
MDIQVDKKLIPVVGDIMKLTYDGQESDYLLVDEVVDNLFWTTWLQRNSDTSKRKDNRVWTSFSELNSDTCYATLITEPHEKLSLMLKLKL